MLSVPDPPEFKVNGDTLIPEGKPVSVMLIGPPYVLLLTLTVIGTFRSPGWMVTTFGEVDKEKDWAHPAFAANARSDSPNITLHGMEARKSLNLFTRLLEERIGETKI